jgi:hypothetical protein
MQGGSRSWTHFGFVDWLVCALILSLGAMQFILIERAPGFVYEDVAYVDLAQSLLYQHSYTWDFAPERVQPPGLAAILAATCATAGCSQSTLLHTTPVFFTAGLLLAYVLVRRQRGFLIATASCLLLAASPELFPFVTSRFWPSFPYLFVSLLILLLVPKLEAAAAWPSRLCAGLLLGSLLAAAMMIQSAAIALIGALLAWALLAFSGDARVAKQRLTLIIPAILLSLLAQVLWMRQGSDYKDWALPGRGDSYLAQLKVKNGNDPELGMASPKDIGLRVAENVKQNTLFLGEIFTHRWIDPSWASIGVGGLLLLVSLGVARSLLRSEGRLCALYFIGYEFIYLLWPWSFETPRFTLPVLPLALLYLAEGVLALRDWCSQYPRAVGAAFLPLTTILTFLAAREGWEAGSGHGFQNKMSAMFWIVCTSACVVLVWKGSRPTWKLPEWWQKIVAFSDSGDRTVFRPTRLLGTVVLTGLVAVGVAAEIPIGRANLTSGLTKFENSPDIHAAHWLQLHTDPNVIVASRQTGVLFHYSGRRVLWFPPITDPKVLLQGLREHHVSYLIVVDHKFSYYLPAETVCFALLQKAYPEAFRLVEASGQLKVYEFLAISDEAKAGHGSQSGVVTGR